MKKNGQTVERVELPLSKNYVGSWGTWEAARELIQNALDGEKVSEDTVLSRARIKYHAKTRTLVVSNENTVLSRRTLVLGHSKKAPGSIGQYGEGYKLALLVLLRGGKSVQICNGSETWVPYISHSRTFDCDVLTLEIQKDVRWAIDQTFAIAVSGITPAEWQEIRRNTRRLQRPQHEAHTSQGFLLSGEGEERRVYVGGLYVCTMQEKDRTYGYDLNPDVVRVDRDRRMVWSWEVNWATAKMFQELREEENKVVEMMKREAPEVASLFEVGNPTGEGEWAQRIADKAFFRFREEHPGALPARNESHRETLVREYGNAEVVVVGEPMSKACEMSNGWDSYIEQFIARKRQTPATFLKVWLDRHSDQISPHLAALFEDEVISEAQGWRA
ncbi:MAG: hypothetical protein WC683_04165 [bacterium]